jgi:hypothetical protein
MANQLFNLVEEFTMLDLEDESSELWQFAIEGVRKMRSQDAAVHNERSVILQWEEAVKNATSTVTGNAIRLMSKGGIRVDKSLIGDIKKRVNSRKKRDLGTAEKTVDSLRAHYQWLTNINERFESEGVPQWLR